MRNPRIKVWRAEWQVDTGGALEFAADSQQQAIDLAMSIIMEELVDFVELDVKLECEDD